MAKEKSKEDVSLLRPVVNLVHFKERLEAFHFVQKPDSGEDWLRTTLGASLLPIVKLERFKERLKSFYSLPEQEPGENWLRTTLRATSSGSKPSVGEASRGVEVDLPALSSVMPFLEAYLPTADTKPGTKSRSKDRLKGRIQGRQKSGIAVKKDFGQWIAESAFANLANRDSAERSKTVVLDSSSIIGGIETMVRTQLFLLYYQHLLDRNQAGNLLGRDSRTGKFESSTSTIERVPLPSKNRK